MLPRTIAAALGAALLLQMSAAGAAPIFLEAETFTSSGGWVKNDAPTEKKASALATLDGSGGARDGIATTEVTLPDAGHYRVWVRYASHPKWRGPFRLSARLGEREVGSGLFDSSFEAKSAKDNFTWSYIEADLPAGAVTLQLSKHENQNCSAAGRHIDCLLLTSDPKLVPNHLTYGAQTFLRVTLGDGYARPAYIHIFADHYHAPWYQHYSLARDGAKPRVSPAKGDLLASGEATPWCNISPLLYQDTGAALRISARYSYTEPAERLRGTFEFATAPDASAVVRTLKADFQPNGVVVLMPPNLVTPENLAIFKTDREVAEETGRLADTHDWPTWGRAPSRFPFFVSAHFGETGFPVDAAVEAREKATLAHYGFTSSHLRHLSGVWYKLNDSYCQPDVKKMEERARAAAAEFHEKGGDLSKVAFCELTDEPTGQELAKMAKDAPATEAFRAWLKGRGQTPAELLVGGWDDVRIVTRAQAAELPALYYWSQRFRTRALGDFMATQRRVLEKAYGDTFPVLANFSDGATYTGNFYAQGVDYFELLDAPDQNAIWGEDWANGSSTYQCASYNVDLMRAATKERGQIIGHHLISHANRKPWDVKLKATSEVARGVRILNSFAYGPSWSSHEGGPYWKSTLWYGKPETWSPYAALTHEIGAAEDFLLEAQPAKAEVALLYSSATDAWTVGETNAYGMDRMHTWLALAHAQVPVDIVSEDQAARGFLEGYKVCYLSGPNLTRAAAEKLRGWVEAGGTLWLTAGAATRDEYNRPLQAFDQLLPAERGEVAELQNFKGSGRAIRTLDGKGEIRCEGGSAEVLSLRQTLKPRQGSAVAAMFADKSPACVSGPAGKGTIYCTGFLPGLSYIKPALVARDTLQERVAQAQAAGTPLAPAESKEAPLLARSANPWKFPAHIRDFILMPVRAARVQPPIACDTALVDAVYMPAKDGILIPLANYTNDSLENVSLKIKVSAPVASVESVRFGKVPFQSPSSTEIALKLRLENNDFLKLHYAR